MGSDLYLAPHLVPEPDPLEQIARKLAYQQQDIDRLVALTKAQHLEIKRLEALLLGREPK